jgi:hypothetical protein
MLMIFLDQNQEVSSASLLVTQIKNPVSKTATPATSTADWKTYTNDTYKFSFKYPSDWTPNIINKASGDNFAFMMSIPNPSSSVQFHTIIVTVWNSIKDFNESNSDPNRMINGTSLKDSLGQIGIYPDLSNVVFMNTNGFKGTNSTQAKSGSDIDYYLNFDNGKILSVKNTINNDVNVSTRQEISEILNTFQFTDSSAAVSTADWKNYTDTTNGFSFKYPATNYVKKVADNDLCVDENPPTSETTTFCQDASGLSIDVTINSKNLNLTDFIKNEKANTGDVYKYEQITVNGIAGIKSTQTSVCDGVGCDYGTYYLQRGSKVISIRFSDPTDKIFSTLLSTFQFNK